MTERDIRLAALYHARTLKIGQTVTIAEFAAKAGVGVGEVIEAVKFIKPYAISESFEIEISSDFKRLTKKKSFDVMLMELKHEYDDRKKFEKKIWNLR